MIRKAFLFLVVSILGLSTSGIAQGYTREFNSSCNCFEVKNHFDNGQLSAHLFELKDGRKNGPEKIFYEDGQLQYERQWVKGILDGEGKHYFRNGLLYYNEVYSNGHKSGTWKFYDQEGDLTMTCTYSGNGTQESYAYYKADVKYLEQLVSNGSLQSESILNQEIYNALKEEAEANKSLKQ